MTRSAAGPTRHLRTSTIVMALILGIAACGGGNGGDGSAAAPPPNNVPRFAYVANGNDNTVCTAAAGSVPVSIATTGTIQ